ncbi:hypothetical protein VTJ49DRAFT_3168 [Mycothermus thermophilus]|uniref:Uncharacterized protein n=1 Tax=Humicola insolens TaxID=85995 RepID=A0ABR3V895_HUMIN
MMVDLSVGQVSGLIAAGVFLVQTILSLAFPAALVSIITPSQSAATWSVLGRALHASPWPTLLQTDSAARRGVRGRVSNGLLLQTITVSLVSIAAIVTPLGLYQVVEPAPGTELVRFAYVQDATPFGFGTPARVGGRRFTRSCGDEVCPGSWVNRTCVRQVLLENCTGVVYGREIPRVWYEGFTEGARRFGESVASIFDVQWRVQVNVSDGFGEYGWYLRSEYRQTGILVLERGLQLVDGLVVDAKGGGGIGFRNHTAPVPPGLEHGATWKEDILFVEPEVQCVNLNVTLDFVLSQNNTSRLTPRELALTDHGGFSELVREKPDLSFDAVQGNGQGPIDLRERAWKAAWAANYLTLAYFNATDFDDDEAVIKRLDVTPGMQFKTNSSAAGVENFGQTDANTFSVEYQAIRTTLDFGEYLILPPTTPRNAASSSINPFGISKAHFHRISDICAGANLSTPANLNATLVGCGLIYGIARRTDTCAASFRASIHTVTLQHNTTTPGSGASDLSSLRAISVTPKSYHSTPSDYPLWAVEDMRSIKLSSAQPLWGIITPSSPLLSQPENTNISATTHHGPHLLLPGLLTSSSTPLLQGTGYAPARQGQNIPGVDFYIHALQAAFTIRRPGSTGYEGYADYSGATSLAAYQRWRELSSSEEGTAELVRMVWTDVAANSVVGTNGWGLGGGRDDENDDKGEVAGLSKRDGSSAATSGEDVAMVPVTVYRRQIRYRTLYMIPAVVVLALAVAVVSTWLVQTVRGQTPVAGMRVMLEATSAGRLMGGILFRSKTQELGLKRARTNEWLDEVGKRTVMVAHGHGGTIITTNGVESESSKEMVTI